MIGVSAPLSFVAFSWVTGWLLPTLLGLLVIVAIVVGIQWIGSEHVDVLAGIPLFSALSRGQLRSVARTARRVDFAPGDRLTEQGGPGSSLYVIQRGTTRVLLNGEPRAALGPGGYFGEIAAIDDGPRSATIEADTATSALEVPGGSLRRQIDADPAFATAMWMGLRTLLQSAGESLPHEDARSVDRSSLVELCRRLRELETPEWATASVRRSRWRRLAPGRA